MTIYSSSRTRLFRFARTCIGYEGLYRRNFHSFVKMGNPTKRRAFGVTISRRKTRPINFHLNAATAYSVDTYARQNNILLFSPE